MKYSKRRSAQVRWTRAERLLLFNYVIIATLMSSTPLGGDER